MIDYRITSNKRPLRLLDHAPRNPGVNRDSAFIGDPASIETLVSSPMHLLMSFVLKFPVYVNFTLYVLIFSVHTYLVSYKTRHYLCQH